jgi:hypothetical protein
LQPGRRTAYLLKMSIAAGFSETRFPEAAVNRDGVGFNPALNAARF